MDINALLYQIASMVLSLVHERMLKETQTEIDNLSGKEYKARIEVLDLCDAICGIEQGLK